VLSKAADRAVQQKLMPVAVALTADGQPTPALLKKLAAVGADASVLPQLKRLPDGKAEALFLDSLVPGALLPRACRRRWTRPSPSCPSPRS
jgi:glycyl-tRNA synthetase beta chain